MKTNEVNVWNTNEKKKLFPGIISSYVLSITTLITFLLAMIAVPISGAFAPDSNITYPYLNTIQQYPRDYIWQYVAMVLMCVYLINFIIVKELINNSMKLYHYHPIERQNS